MVSISFDKNKYVFTNIPMMLISSQDDKSEIIKEIHQFLSELEKYNIIFKDLVNYPLEESKRNLALNIAYYITENIEINDKVIESKRLPIKELSRAVKISPSNLDILEDYILTYYIIITNLKYKSLQEHLKIKLSEKNKVIDLNSKKNMTEKGIVLKVNKNSAYILTPTGGFYKVKTKGQSSIGEICEGKECTRINRFKIHISIFLIILTVICSGIVVEYTRVNRIVVIQCTSSIKIHINKFNKVIYAYSGSEKGQNLINEANIENKDLDFAISEIFKLGIEDEMMSPPTKVLMTIAGKPIEYGSLTETQKIVGENKILLTINNVGNEQTMPTYESSNE